MLDHSVLAFALIFEGLAWLILRACSVGRLGRWLARTRVKRTLLGATMIGFGVKLASEQA